MRHPRDQSTSLPVFGPGELPPLPSSFASPPPLPPAAKTEYAALVRIAEALERIATALEPEVRVAVPDVQHYMGIGGNIACGNTTNRLSTNRRAAVNCHLCRNWLHNQHCYDGPYDDDESPVGPDQR